MSQRCQVLILKTTPTHYISGKHALNLPAPEGTSGDWHMRAVFYDITGDNSSLSLLLAGDGETLNTNHIYGSYGIYECTDAMKRCGLNVPEGTENYAANHFRAILDMVYNTLKKHSRVVGLQCSTDEWLDTQAQKKELLTQALKMKPFLTAQEQVELDKWIEYEKTNEYWNGKR